MRNFLRGGIAALAGLLFLTSAAQAKRIAIPPLPDRLASAAAAVVGKVTAIEDKTVKTAEGELGVAVIKVETGLLGARGLTHVKVGFRAGQIKPNEELFLILSKSSVENIYVAPRFWDIVRKSDGGDFAAQAAFARRCAPLLDDPRKGLKAKDAGDRLLAAALLIGKHRPWGRGSEKQEPIDAAESKLILEALAAADWNTADPVARVNAQQLFYRLGINQTDGWMEPANFMQRNEAMKKWLKDNADKYRVKKFVFGKSE